MNRDITGAMRGEAKRGEEVCNVESNESPNEEKPAPSIRDLVRASHVQLENNVGWI